MHAFYEIGDVIGEGGFAIVYSAIRKKDGKLCAIKQLKEEFKHNDTIIRRFDREVRIQLRLSHPYIVPILQIEPADSPPWFVMPRAICNLNQLFESEGYGEQHIPLFKQLLEAVEYAHIFEGGSIHRDLKPSNVLIFWGENDERYAAMSDFGLARLELRDSSPLTTSTEIFGTYGYLAPELYKEKGYKYATKMADIYSLGKILYVLLTAQPPYPLYISDIPSKFKAIILKATDDNPYYRYRSVSELSESISIITNNIESLKREEYPYQKRIMNLLEKGDIDSINALLNLFIENIEDSELLIRGFPVIQRSFLVRMVDNNSIFKTILFAYDSFLEDKIPSFEYCDIVADNYKVIFQITDDFEIKRLILKRLANLGFEKHRYYVRDVFAEIVDGLSDPQLVLALCEEFTANPQIIGFNAEKLQEKRLPPALKKILEQNLE